MVASPEQSEIGLVDDLSAAYARVLETTWSLPALGRRNPEIARIDNDSVAVTRLGWAGLLAWPLRLPFYPIREWWSSFMLAPVISLYVNTHINANSSKLRKNLLRQRLKEDKLSGVDTAGLDSSIAALERLKVLTTGWVMLLVILRFIPVIGLLFSMGIVTVSFTLKDTPVIALQLISALWLIVLMIHPLLVQFGFRWKRALFAGSANAASAVGPESTDETADWPVENTYQIEKRTFGRLGIKRPTEFPVDLFLAPGIYFLLFLMIGLALGSITFNEDASPNEERMGNAVIFSFFVVLFVMSFIRLVLRYRLRRAAGMI